MIAGRRGYDPFGAAKRRGYDPRAEGLRPGLNRENACAARITWCLASPFNKRDYNKRLSKKDACGGSSLRFWKPEGDLKHVHPQPNRIPGRSRAQQPRARCVRPVGYAHRPSRGKAMAPSMA